MKRYMSVLLLALLVLGSCKKDDSSAGVSPFYSISVDGVTVTFTNASTGASTYKWDFGDGATSNETSPVHVYPGKGKYVPTLYATGTSGKTAEASTVIRLSKPSPVKLDDNTLSDWDTITHNMIVSGPGGGIFRKAKFDYDGNNVYLYFEIATSKANGDIFDMYLDTDNDATTGYLNGEFSGGGYDVLLEGPVLQSQMDVYYHSGDQASFGGFAGQSVSESQQVGTVVESGGILKFEMKLVRSKLKNLSSTTGLKLGIVATKNDWSVQLGTAPDDNTPAFYLDMTE